MFTVGRDIAAPSEAVWNILTALDAWPRWGPTVAGAELAEPGPLRLGSLGKVWTSIGVPLPFEITDFETGRTWAWKVAGVPATAHGVEPAGEGCRATMSVPIWAPVYLTVCALALKRIDQMATV
jgi:hypothetical protein